MKKICAFVLALSFLFSFQLETAPQAEAYSLKDALGKDQEPKYLPIGTQKTNAQEGDKSIAEDPARPITRIIQNLINGITGITAAIAIFMIILNAQNIIFAAGDSDAISKGKKGLMWGVIALLLITFAYVIVKTFIQFTYFGEV